MAKMLHLENMKTHGKLPLYLGINTIGKISRALDYKTPIGFNFHFDCIQKIYFPSIHQLQPNVARMIRAQEKRRKSKIHLLESKIAEEENYSSICRQYLP